MESPSTSSPLTAELQATHLNGWDRTWSAALATICFGSVTMNITVLVTLFQSLKKRKRALSWLLISLFCTDLILGLTNAPVFMLNSMYGEWKGGEVSCMFLSSTSVMLCCQSILTLTAIAYDRYCVIIKQSKWTELKTGLATLLTWVISLTLGCLQVFAPETFPVSVTVTRFFCTPQWYGYNGATWYTWLCIMILGFALLCTTLLYVSIVRYMKVVFEQVLQTRTRAKEEEEVGDNDRKWLRRMIILVIAFVIAWLGYLINMLYQVISHTSPPEWLDGLTTAFGFGNSLVNPILYTMFEMQDKTEAKEDSEEEVIRIEEERDDASTCRQAPIVLMSS